MPNAIVPAIQVTALQLAWMAGGVVVVEFVFQYPGSGPLVDAVALRDIPVVQTVTMLAAGIYVGLNLWPTSRRSWSLRSSGRPADEPASPGQTVDTAIDLAVEAELPAPRGCAAASGPTSCFAPPA